MAKAKPRGKAKTAYELLGRVAEHIMEEPKRYYQEWWGYRGKAVIARRFGKEAVPACGTMACRAGWIVALHDGPSALGQLTVIPSSGLTGDRADEILGMTDGQTNALFDGSAVNGRPGTVAYARKGAAGIRAFMRKHKAHLQARSLKGV